MHQGFTHEAFKKRVWYRKRIVYFRKFRVRCILRPGSPYNKRTDTQHRITFRLAMRRRGYWTAAVVACGLPGGPRVALACTTIAVGKNASSDGSTMCTHNADVSDWILAVSNYSFLYVSSYSFSSLISYDSLNSLLRIQILVCLFDIDIATTAHTWRVTTWVELVAHSCIRIVDIPRHREVYLVCATAVSMPRALLVLGEGRYLKRVAFASARRAHLQ